MHFHHYYIVNLVCLQLVVKAKEDENMPNSDELDLAFRRRINESRQYSSAVPSCKNSSIFDEF